MKQKKIYWFASDPRAKIPTQEKNSVGYDLYALPEENFQGAFVLHPGEKHIFHTGLKCIIPDDYWLSFWERSSTGNLQMNLHAGVIDSSYRGELMIILANYTNYDMVATARKDTKLARFIIHLIRQLLKEFYCLNCH